MSPLVKKISQEFDYSLPETFLRKTLTFTQAEQRIKILEIQKKTLAAEEKPLSPRSAQELDQLQILPFQKQSGTIPCARIYRRHPSQFYTVEIIGDPNKQLLRQFKKAGENLRCVEQVFPSKPSTSTLLALFSEQKQKIDWYNAIFETIGESNGDPCITITNQLYELSTKLSLLAKEAQGTSAPLDTLTEIQSKIRLAYEAQKQFNRLFQWLLLDLADHFRNSLRELQEQISTCGRNLQTSTQNFFPSIQELHQKQGDHLAKASTEMDAIYEKFCKELASVSQTMNSSLSKFAAEESLKSSSSLLNLLQKTLSASPNHLREKIERIKTTLALSSSPQDQPFAHAAVEPVFWTKKTIANMQDAVNCMDLWGEKMALCHAFWLQFHQHNSFIDQLNQHMVANWHEELKSRGREETTPSVSTFPIETKKAEIPLPKQLLQQELEEIEELIGLPKNSLSPHISSFDPPPLQTHSPSSLDSAHKGSLSPLDASLDSLEYYSSEEEEKVLEDKRDTRADSSGRFPSHLSNTKNQNHAFLDCSLL